MGSGYITLQQLRQFSLGIDSTLYPDPDMQGIIDVAKEMVDAYCGRDFIFRTVRNEERRWRGNLSFSTFYRPRVIQSMQLVTGTYAGQGRFYTIATTPVETTGSPFHLPAQFGDVALNRAARAGQAANLLFTTGAVALANFPIPWTSITYTTGFDYGLDTNGVIQYPDDSETGEPQTGDGFSVPMPHWLTLATRLIAKDLIGEYVNARRGLTGLLEIRVADTTYRRPLLRPHIDYTINPQAQKILDRHRNVWAA